MILPIKYKIFDNKLWTLSFEDKWQVAKANVNSPYIPITQGFGVDFIYNKDTPVGWKGRYFYKDIIGGMEGHNGIDFVAPLRTSLFAPEDGIISRTSITYGKAIYLRGNYEHVFGHLNDILVIVGQEVKQGQLIGYCDNTGLYTTGSHLHWGLRPLDYDPQNGFGGYVDFRNMIADLSITGFPAVYRQIDEYRIQTGVEFNLTEEWKKIQKRFNTKITLHDFHEYLDLKSLINK